MFGRKHDISDNKAFQQLVYRQQNNSLSDAKF